MLRCRIPKALAGNHLGAWVEVRKEEVRPAEGVYFHGHVLAQNTNKSTSAVEGTMMNSSQSGNIMDSLLESERYGFSREANKEVNCKSYAV